MGYIDQITHGGTTLYTLGMQPINIVIMVGMFIDLMGLGGDNQQTWWI
jgi:hypothetical protein